MRHTQFQIALALILHFVNPIINPIINPIVNNAQAIEIALKNRVPNQEPGYCAWAALETCAKERRIIPLYGLVEQRKLDPPEWVNLIDDFGINKLTLVPSHVGGDWAMKAKLDALNVKYQIQLYGVTNHAILKRANSHGVVIGMKPGATGPRQTQPHAILLTHYQEIKDGVELRYIDSNNVSVDFVAGRSWFEAYWNGMALVLEDYDPKQANPPDRPKAPAPTTAPTPAPTPAKPQ